MVRVSLIAVSQPLYGVQDPRRLVEVAVKTSSGKVKENGWMHYLFVDREDHELNEWLLKAAKNFPSVLEHVSLTFMIEDISRVTSHQLVRHRIASYTQESLRYSVLANSKDIINDAEFVIECVRTTDEKKYKRCWDEAVNALKKYFVLPAGFESSATTMEQLANALFEYAIAIKVYGESPEDARFVLPMATKTRIMMTVNLRELLHILCMRRRQEAQWEIREVAYQMATEVQEKLKIPIEEMVRAYCR